MVATSDAGGGQRDAHQVRIADEQRHAGRRHADRRTEFDEEPGTARDPEMHRARKGNQWYFGLKAHIGVDLDSGLVHTLVTTSANVSDISQTQAFLHGQESKAWADAGYGGGDKREDMQRALAANGQEVQWHIAKRRKTMEKLAEGWQRSLAPNLR